MIAAVAPYVVALAMVALVVAAAVASAHAREAVAEGLTTRHARRGRETYDLGTPTTPIGHDPAWRPLFRSTPPGGVPR